MQFIHEEATGIDERKVEKMKNHSKYKTQECKTFKELGTCPYGDKCAFIHKPKVVQCIECTDAPINFLQKQQAGLLVEDDLAKNLRMTFLV